MADRRMLWKNVCRSRKVNSLSDKAALLWTWTIPFFDRDGFLEAEPDYIQEVIFPKKNTLREEVLRLLLEIFKSGLWEPYEYEGKIIAFDPKFKKFQKIQYDREAKSDFKGVCSKITLEQLLERSMITLRPIGEWLGQNAPQLSTTYPLFYPQDENSKKERDSGELSDTLRLVLEDSKSTLDKDKIREEKLDKESEQPQNQLVDNFSQEEPPAAAFLNPEKPEPSKFRLPSLYELFPEESRLPLKDLCENIDKLLPSFNPWRWIQINKDKNPKTLLHCLKQLNQALLKANQEKEYLNPWAYLTHIIQIEESNFNEADFQQKASKNKAGFNELIDKLKTLQSEMKEEKT